MELLFKIVECLNYSLFSVLFFSIVALFCKYMKIGNRLPPGPIGIPFLGYFLFLKDDFPKQMNRLAKRYGPVFQLTVGSSQMIILNSIESIKEGYRQSALSGRPRSKVYDMFRGYGITNVNGLTWQGQRKFIHTQLRSLGMKVFGPQREKMERTIMGEVLPFLSNMKANKGQSVNPNPHFTLMASNILSVILMAKKFKSEDADYKKMSILNQEGIPLFMQSELAIDVPFMKYIPSYANAFQKLMESHKTEKAIIQKYVSDSRNKFDPEAPVEDLIGTYLSAERNAIEGGQNVSIEETDDQIIQTIMDLYSGGSETTKSFFNWSFLILLHYPDVVKKIQSELDYIVGRDRLPALEDLLSLHYTRAAISEVLRFVTIIPLAMHAAVEDTTIGGYFVPKGARVFANHYSIHNNPRLFPKPEKYIPERFIDSSGRYFTPEGFVAFGFGQRGCLAEVMAKCEAFLLVACTLHSNNIAPSNTKGLPDLKGLYTFSNNPKDYEIRFLQRDDLLVDFEECISEYEK